MTQFDNVHPNSKLGPVKSFSRFPISQIDMEKSRRQGPLFFALSPFAVAQLTAMT
jgi:hypothetical protein